MKSEQALFDKFIELKEKKDEAEKQTKELGKLLDRAEAALIEHLEQNDATATSKYEGRGYAKVMRPRLFASCKVEFREALMKHLKEVGRQDMIKVGVAAASLSAYVSECMGSGAEFPKYIDYFLKAKLRVFK